MSACLTCGHSRQSHIYDEGACRPGFVCSSGCQEYLAPGDEMAGALCPDESCGHRAIWHHDERGCEYHGNGQYRCACLLTSDAVVERIIDARLAPIRALADEWENVLVKDEWDAAYKFDAVPDQLRAALAASAPVNAQQDHGGQMCAAECGRPVDRVLPNPIPFGTAVMFSEVISGRAIYCQTCFDKHDPEDDL